MPDHDDDLRPVISGTICGNAEDMARGIHRQLVLPLLERMQAQGAKGDMATLLAYLSACLVLQMAERLSPDTARHALREFGKRVDEWEAAQQAHDRARAH